MTAAANRRLRPKRSASTPVSGVRIAAATMYDVSTHEIWSCVADMLPCMCGSATLTIVVSTTCMTVASMTDNVIMPRFSGASVLAVALIAVALIAG